MRAIVGLVGALLIGGLFTPPSAHAVDPATPESVRILIVGDSVTQGSAGDWTWRYRLWRHFAAAGVAVDFVGPRDDVYDNGTGLFGSMAYADPGFDRDHAARWGMQLDIPDVPVGQLVETYQPDVVVEMLGVNDLIFGGRSAEVVAGRIADLVDEARAARPTVDLVLAEATQTWFPSVPEFNEVLAGLADMSTPDSQVVVAHAAARYDKYADTWDTSHPNARGEVRIAAAVADSLHALGVGPPAVRPLVMPPVGPRSPPRVEARAGDGAIELTWIGPPGATAHYVWGRDTTVEEPWQRLPGQVSGSTWTAYFLTNGHRYQYRLQPIKGDDEPQGAVYSDVVTAVPLRAPAAPTGLRAASGRTCATLAWDEPEFATHYRVARHTRSGWRHLAQVRRPRFTAEGLPALSAWRFRVTPWHSRVRGQPAWITVRRGPTAAPCR